MTKKLATLAGIVAGAIRAADKGRYDIATWDELRDRVDSATNSDLDCHQLDILTDMVEARLMDTVRVPSTHYCAHIDP